MPPVREQAAMRRVAVLQSNYIPWKGYFDLIHDVDVFIFYDDNQYTKNDWRNRNQLKGPGGAQWLTIPVGDRLDRLICEVELPPGNWATKHWRTIEQLYAKAPHFARYRGLFESIYLDMRWSLLSDLNQHLVRTIARDVLEIRTEFQDSRAYRTQGAKLDKLLDLLGQSGATHYLSGPAARDYIDPARFSAAGIALEWKSYAGYPEYPQRHGAFVHGVSILDLIFNVGPEAPRYIWGWRGSP
ncbi:MAG: WbqC family protein [Rubrivivax sp.]|nr:WbqC family protein [Rubrivivax sp.]